MHILIALAIGLVVGGGLGYAFRGYEHATLVSANNLLTSQVNGLKAQLASLGKKL